MAIPIIFGIIAGISGAVGVGKGIKGAADTKEANEVQERAQRTIDRAKNSMDKTRDNTNVEIQNLGRTKIEASANELNTFVQTFSKIHNVNLGESLGLDELKKLKITSNSLKDMKDTALGAVDVLSGGVAGIGAGVLLGWGTYGGVMALGTASTGAAIGGLSGIAATNATLAWLGGGALAAGGGGMALGTAVLGGIIAGPALLLAGGIFGSRAKEKLNNAYSNLSEAKEIAEEIKTAETELNIITENAKQLNQIIRNLSYLLEKANDAMKEITYKKTDWKQFSGAEKEIIVAAMKSAQIVKIVIDVPLLTDQGVLTQDIRRTISDPKILTIAALA